MKKGLVAIYLMLFCALPGLADERQQLLGTSGLGAWYQRGASPGVRGCQNTSIRGGMGQRKHDRPIRPLSGS
jgi:hypothetical protein